MRSLLHALAILALSGASPIFGQWDSIPFVAANPVFDEGFLVAHENADGVNAFSSASRKWSLVAGPSAGIVGTGDWTMLVRDGFGTYIGYSARRNSSAVITIPALAYFAVEDDVILLVEANPPRAHGYSAVTNTWSTIPLTSVPPVSDVATSRFVIGLRDNLTYWGFGARKASWTPLPVASRGSAPIADGNVVLVDLLDPFSGTGTPDMAAFSGVRNNWAISPPYFFPNGSLLDHNVAYTRVPAGGGFVGCAYSAYNGGWVTSGTPHGLGVSEKLTDNVVRIDDPDPTKRFEACGALPQTWSLLPGNLVDIVLDEDYTVVQDGGVTAMFAFSGLCKNMWVPMPLTFGVPAVSPSSPDHMASLIEGTVLHVFAPETSVWAAPFPIPSSAVLTIEDTVTDVRIAGAPYDGIAGRWNLHTPGPIAGGPAYTTISAGSVIAHQQTAGAGAGDVTIFDERCDDWPAAFSAGVGSILSADRNLVVANPVAGGLLWGYSVQRGDWTTPGPIPMPLAVPPTLDENVAWLVDGAGELWGFGTPNEGNVYYPWPNGTEYNTSGPIPGTTISSGPFGYSILGIPGTTGGFGLVSPFKVHPGVVTAPILGLACLDLTTYVSMGFFGITDADCLREKLPTTSSSFGGCIQFWLQPLIYDFFALTFRWGHRCDPAWFF